MTLEDISKLEARFSIQLPERYRRFLQKPPFDEKSGAFECLRLANLDGLIERNVWLREQDKGHPCLQPRSDCLWIGSDLSESWYVMNLKKPRNPVLEVDNHETVEVVKTYPSFANFLKTMRENDRESDDEDEEEAATTEWPAVLTGAIFLIGWLIYLFYKHKV